MRELDSLPSGPSDLNPAVESICPESGTGSSPDSEVHELSGDVRKIFQRQARKIESEVIEAFHALTKDRYDLVEVCAPWDSTLSKAVEEAGGKAYRMGLHNGYDLMTRAGLRKAVETLKKLRPRYVHISPPCYPWTIMNNAIRRRKPRESTFLRNEDKGA